MNRAAILVVGTALSLFACAHDDTTPASKTPTGSTELQGSGTSVDNVPAASPTKPADATTVVPTAGQSPPSAAPSAPVPPPAAGTAPSSRPDGDNTRVNARDRGGAETPVDQGNNPTDLKITQAIRKAVMADGTLSFTAQNVKIITRGAKVVLRGPVKTAQERATIEATARATTGVTDVDDELEVKQ